MDALGGTAVVLSGGLAALTCLVVCVSSTFRTQQRAAEEWARVTMLHEEVAEEEGEGEEEEDGDNDGDDEDRTNRPVLMPVLTSSRTRESHSMGASLD